jgi:hypothetical protein
VGRKPSPNSSRADDPFQAKHAARGRRLGLLVYVAAAGLGLWNAHVGLALSTALWLLWGALEYSAEKDDGAPPTTSNGR